MPRPTREQIEAELRQLPPEQHGAFLAEVERRLKDSDRPAGYRFAESLHTDAQGRTLSFPHMAVPADPEARAAAMTAVTLPVGGAAMKAAGALPGAAGSMARMVAASPSIAGAAGGAIPQLLEGDLRGAALWGTLGALMGRAPGMAGSVLRGAERFAPKAAPAVEAVSPAVSQAVAAGRSASGAVPAAVAAPRTLGGMISASVPAAAPSAAAAPAAVAAPAGKAFNTIWREFAKAAAPTAKKGERIWIKLDERGIPVDIITPGQASRVPAAMKTWVARTW